MGNQAKDPATITPLIRQFSLREDEDIPKDTLSETLVSVVHKEDEEKGNSEQQTVTWKRWIEFGSSGNDMTIQSLDNQRLKVVDLWKKFNHLFPDEKDSLQPLNAVPTIATLFEAINQAQTTWHAKQAKGYRALKGRFVNFAETMNEYSYLFKVIPSGDKYTSLITGVVSSVVSMNHRKIADGFSQALSDMSDELRSVQKSTEIVDSPDMRRFVVNLYVDVFELLCHGLSWFTSKRKRLSAAFKKNFYDETVTRLLDSIRKTVLAIDREKRHIADGWLLEVRQVVVQGGPHVVDRLRPVGNQNRRDDPAAICDKFGSMKVQLGSQVVRTLADQEHDYESTAQEIESPDDKSATEEVDTIDTEVISEDDIDDQCSRHDIEELAGHLAQYLDDGRQTVSNAMRGNHSSLLPNEVLLEMQKWIETPDSKMIWVYGVTTMRPYGTGLSSAAMRICNISIQTGIPCVSFFCKTRYDFAKAKGLTHQEAGLVAFLYSVISQLACLLPTAFPATEGLDESHFRLLDGSMESASTAIKLIRALLIHAPQSLVWVIDGFRLLENNVTFPHLQSFIQILRDEETKRISKVCFTTDHNSRVLSRSMSIRERVDASRAAQNRPGNMLRGGSNVNILR